jgi:hypothetical protein
MNIGIQPNSVVFFFCALVARALGDNITYQISLTPEVCHEVHVGKFTVPSGFPPSMVVAGDFRYDIRSGGESLLLIAAAYTSAYKGVPPSRLAPAPEKYAVDLNQPKSFRRLSEAEWQAGAELKWNHNGIMPRESDRGVQYRGPLLERSGPKWAGVGGSGGPLRTDFSVTNARAAVLSWDGFDLYSTPLDMSWRRPNIKGEYGVDI